MARDLMDDACRRVNAIRRAWNEGQLEWTVQAGALIERTRGVRCHKPLPERHLRFCGELCADAHNENLNRTKEAHEDHRFDHIVKKRGYHWI